MKNSKLVITLLALLLTSWSFAQDFKIAKSSGRLEIGLGRVTVEGYAGNEIVFSAKGHSESKDERATGLRAINGSGLDDNTGLGINVTDKGNVIEVSQLRKMNSPDVKIMVPKGVIVSFTHDTQYGGTATFKNMENEIEVSANYNSIELENVTGPLTIKTVYGHVEADLSQNVKGPLSIVSIYGYVDVTLPVATKANLKMSTSYGELLVAPEFKIEIDRQGDMVRYSDKVNGRINGGGFSIDLRSDYSKIYLRKK
jgi:predicted membrane protein